MAGFLKLATHLHLVSWLRMSGTVPTFPICLMKYLLTYLLTPCSRVLLEKLTGFAANQEIPRILWNPKAHYRTQKRTSYEIQRESLPFSSLYVNWQNTWKIIGDIISGKPLSYKRLGTKIQITYYI